MASSRRAVAPLARPRRPRRRPLRRAAGISPVMSWAATARSMTCASIRSISRTATCRPCTGPRPDGCGIPWKGTSMRPACGLLLLLLLLLVPCTFLPTVAQAATPCAPTNYTHLSNTSTTGMAADYCSYAYLPFRVRLPDTPQHLDTTYTPILQNE